MDTAHLKAIAQQFKLKGEIDNIAPYGNGHINDTYKIEMCGDGMDYILQRINHKIFTNPVKLQENIERVTAHISGKLGLKDGEQSSNVLQLVYTEEGLSYVLDGEDYYRVFIFIENSVGHDIVSSPELAYEGGKAFGQFQANLKDLPGGPLFEIIPNFHNIKWRLGNLDKAIAADVKGRVAEVADVLAFIDDHREVVQQIITAGEAGEIPLRVTHNDTKFNNVLCDATTNKALSVIDLDTIMNGYVHYDFGDSIRTATNTGAEDDANLDNVSMDISLFEGYTKGFLEAVGADLNAKEIELLPNAALTITFTIGLRFITDYLEGDVYFKIHHEGHNLQRARAQFKLVQSIEEQQDAMAKVIADCLA